MHVDELDAILSMDPGVSHMGLVDSPMCPGDSPYGFRAFPPEDYSYEFGGCPLRDRMIPAICSGDAPYESRGFPYGSWRFPHLLPWITLCVQGIAPMNPMDINIA